MANKRKLGISNIAWYPDRFDRFIELVASLGFEGIELAASILWPEPSDATAAERKALKRKIEDNGMKIIGLQSLLYTRPDLVLFEDKKTREKILNYLSVQMDLCADLGGKVLVFGSPRNRNKGEKSTCDVYPLAVDFFKKVASRAKERNVTFCIEPLGRTETDFINSVEEAETLMKDAGDPEGLGLHIDTKGLIDEKEYNASYLENSFSSAMHVHVNDPGLKPPGSTGFDHRLISSKLKKSGYTNYISIEMRRVDSDVEGTIRRAAEYVKRLYIRDET